MTPPAKNIVFIGAHLGYPMDCTPLGGGAMVGLQLARRWAKDGRFRLKALGSGPLAPSEDVDYWTSGVGGTKGLVKLSEFGYARFCRAFEGASAAWLEDHRAEFPPESTCVVLNDISESPDPARLSRLGYPIVSIWHVDVVDYFNKMYFRNLFAPRRWTGAYDRLARAGLDWTVPDLLRLVFDKQRKTVMHSRRLVVPSRRMGETIRECYRSVLPADALIDVVPWGSWDEKIPEDVVAPEVRRLKERYRIGPKTKVLMTLSRISPEKGIVLLLEALLVAERAARAPAEDLCLFICGEPAFMRGESYMRLVRAAAARLKKTRVFFVGYLPPKDKQVYFRLADLFVSPSIHESYGLTVVEAMRAGLPILASDHSGAEETLSPEFSRIVPYEGKAGGFANWGAGRRGDIPRRIARELERLLAEPAALRAMGARAKEAAARVDFDGASRRVADGALDALSPAPAAA
ncbi:MAG: glycosyltransferase family 4 protein [Elusimicrobia bacterium]|nr:glycosyltransferase family 4 protein [Elusimicrobiota bacterium]